MNKLIVRAGAGLSVAIGWMLVAASAAQAAPLPGCTSSNCPATEAEFCKTQGDCKAFLIPTKEEANCCAEGPKRVEYTDWKCIWAKEYGKPAEPKCPEPTECQKSRVTLESINGLCQPQA